MPSMSLNDAMWFALLLLVLAPLVPLLWSLAKGERRVRRRLGELSVRTGEDHLVPWEGQALEARVVHERGGIYLEVTGPRLPLGVPTFAPASALSLPGPQVRTGDADFDDHVCVTHEDADVAISWLQHDARDVVREAVAMPARLVDRRWHSRQLVSPRTNVDDILGTLAAATAALSTAPSVDEVLTTMASSDPVPLVRVRAMEALADRGQLTPALLAHLTNSPHTAAHLAVVRHGTPHAVAAWNQLRRFGSRRQRAEGAVAVARHGLRADPAGKPLDFDVLASELIEALASDAHGEAAAEMLASMDHPDLLNRLEEHFAEGLPTSSQALHQTLTQRAREASRGNVSLAEVAGGNLSIAKE